jgi:hypothetical protein
MMYSKHHANSKAGAIIRLLQTARLEQEKSLVFLTFSNITQTARLKRLLTVLQTARLEQDIF